MEKLTCEKTRAAYLLSDEIFGAFRGAQLANHLLNSAMDFRLDDEEIDDTDQYVLRATFKELIWRMDILSHYLSEVMSDPVSARYRSTEVQARQSRFQGCAPESLAQV